MLPSGISVDRGAGMAVSSPASMDHVLNSSQLARVGVCFVFIQLEKE